MPTLSPMIFEGLKAVELVTSSLRLVAVQEYGPRLAFLGKSAQDDNLLFWKPGKYLRGAWDLRGGHRVWVTRPGADECEETYVPDNGPCELELLPDGFRLTGAESPVTRARRGLAVRARGERHLEVDHFVTNTGEMLYSGGIWALTCTRPGRGARYAVPIGDGSRFDTFTLVAFRTWGGGHGRGGFNDPQFTVHEDLLVVTPQGVENKRMLQSHHGLIAMSDPSRDLTFAKKVGWQPGSQYPMGSNIAFYIGPDNFMVEMETMGPERPLKPGETLHHVETWTLQKGAIPLDRAETLLRLFV